MNEIKSLRKNSFFSFFNAFTTLLFPLITFPYASRILHPEGIGKNNFAVSIEGYFAMLAGLGISSYATREAAKLRENKFEFSKFCKEIITINLISMIISYALLVTLLFTVPKFEQYRLIILVRSMNIFFSTIGLEWLYRAEEDFKYITLRSFIFKIAGLIFLFIFVRDQDDIVEYTFFGILTSVASNICNLFHSTKYIDYKIKCKLEITKHLKFIFTFFGMVVITSLYTILDTSLLGFLSDDFQVGLYTAATKLNKISLTLITSLTAVLLPRLSHYAKNNEKEKIIELSQKSASIIILLSLPIIVGLIFLAKPLTLIFSGKEYLQAIPAMNIISPIVFFISLSSLIGGQIFASINKEKLTLISTTIAAVINITMNLIFIPKYGAVGAAIGTVIAEFCVTFFQVICIRKYIKKSILITFFQSIIGCIIISIEIIFVTKFINNNILIILSSLLISILSYSTVLYFFHNKYFIELLNFIKNKILKKDYSIMQNNYKDIAKPKIIYVKQEAIVEDYLFADLQFSQDSKIIIIRKTLLGKMLIGKNSPITKITKKLHLYNALSNSRLTSTLGKYIGKKTKNSVLILQAQILNFVGVKYLLKLSKKYNCKLCILTLDSIHASSPTFKSVLPIILENKWDKIYTYDEYDAKEFGWTAINKAYFSTSKYPKINNLTKPEYDLYFTGGLKGNKDPLVFSSFKLFKENGLNPLYALFCSDQKKFDEYSAQYKDIHFYNKWRSYDDIIQETMNSKCIVEILQENQKSQSVRYFEAILFNKKLLTNNPDIKKLPYYNPQYMQYFSSIDQIDIEWIKKDIKVEYNYQNDITPLKFIEQVKTDFLDLF